MEAITPTDRRLALTVIAGTVVFAAAAVLLPFVQGASYHPVRDAIDDLVLGRDGWVIALGFAAAAVATFALAALLYRTVHRAVAGPALLLLAGALRVVLAVTKHVPDGRPRTTSSNIHETAGVLVMVVTMASMFALLRPFGGDGSWRSFRRVQLGWSVVALLLFVFVSPPIVGEAHFGVAQRIGEAALFAWMVAVAARPLTAPVSAPSSARAVTGVGWANET